MTKKVKEKLEKRIFQSFWESSMKQGEDGTDIDENKLIYGVKHQIEEKASKEREVIETATEEANREVQLFSSVLDSVEAYFKRAQKEVKEIDAVLDHISFTLREEAHIEQVETVENDCHDLDAPIETLHEIYTFLQESFSLEELDVFHDEDLLRYARKLKENGPEALIQLCIADVKKEASKLESVLSFCEKQTELKKVIVRKKETLKENERYFEKAQAERTHMEEDINEIDTALDDSMETLKNTERKLEQLKSYMDVMGSLSSSQMRLRKLLFGTFGITLLSMITKDGAFLPSSMLLAIMMGRMEDMNDKNKVIKEGYENYLGVIEKTKLSYEQLRVHIGESREKVERFMHLFLSHFELYFESDPCYKDMYEKLKNMKKALQIKEDELKKKTSSIEKDEENAKEKLKVLKKAS